MFIEEAVKPESSTHIPLLIGLVGALLAAIPGILGATFTWLKGRDSVSQSHKRIELAKAEVEFIATWLATVSALGDETELKQRQAQASARLDNLMSQTQADIEQSVSDAKIAKTSPQKENKNIGFFIYSGFFFFLLLGSSIDDQDDFSWPQFIKETTEGDGPMMMFLFGVPWLLLLIRFIWQKLKK